MPTETKEQFEERIRLGQAKFDAFRYTDAQRRQVLQFIEAANRVIRGEAKFTSLSEFLQVDGVFRAQKPEGAKRYSFDTRFLNDWTGIYMNVASATDGTRASEPVLFEVTFDPEMTSISREHLEQLLKLRAIYGWTSEGGNLREPGFPLHGLIDRTANFLYSPLEQPSKDFTVEVTFIYLGAPTTDLQGLYAANELSQIKIRRRYLTPEEIHERDHKRLGHMPHTGERCTARVEPANAPTRPAHAQPHCQPLPRQDQARRDNGH